MTVVAVLQALRLQGAKGHLYKGAVASFGIRIAYIVLEFASVVILARCLNASGFGIYAYAMAIMRVVAIPAQAGLPTLVVREVAGYLAVDRYSLLRGVLVRSNQYALALSLLAAVAAWAFIHFTSDPGQEGLGPTLSLALVALPLVALGNIRGAALRGMKKIVAGQLPENVIRPGMLALLVLIAIALGTRMDPVLAMSLYLASAIISFVVGSMLLYRELPPAVKTVAAEYDTRRWLRAIAPLSLLSGLQVTYGQISIIALGWFATPADVGVFRVVVQCGLLVAFASTAINMAIAPYVASYNSVGAHQKMQALATASARATFAFSALIGLGFLLLGKPLLVRFFGPEFGDGYVPLLIVAAGQIASSAMGVAMIFLNMSGNETGTLKSFLVTTLISAVLNVIFVPRWGILGASIGTAIGMLLLSIQMAAQVRSRLGVRTWVR